MCAKSRKMEGSTSSIENNQIQKNRENLMEKQNEQNYNNKNRVAR